MLNGATVLVIEEEFLIALDIERMLQVLDAGQVLFARSALEAQSAQHLWTDVRLAIVEITLRQEQTLALVGRLLDLGICVVLCSADSALRDGLQQFPGTPVVCKPMAEPDLVAAIGNAMGRFS